MMVFLKIRGYRMVGLVLALQACSSAPEVANAEPSSKAQPSPVSAPALPGVPGVLQSYEELRHLFAEDRVAEARSVATELASRAGLVANAANAAPELAEIVKTATALAKVSSEEDAATRKAFGELSRSIVDLVAQDSALQKDLHMFECPMAEGFKRWVQTAPKIENPYMGSKMLRCGAKRDF